MRAVSTTNRWISVKNWFVRPSNCSKGLLALQIVHFLFSVPVAYRPHPLYWHVLMQLRMLKLCVGKGRQVIKQLCSRVLQYYSTVATERAGYVLYRTLVATVTDDSALSIDIHTIGWVLVIPSRQQWQMDLTLFKVYPPIPVVWTSLQKSLVPCCICPLANSPINLLAPVPLIPDFKTGWQIEMPKHYCTHSCCFFIVAGFSAKPRRGQSSRFESACLVVKVKVVKRTRTIGADQPFPL